MGLDALPRVKLANLPTPLDEAVNLRAKIGGPRLLIKRDDLTGLALGGNKLRKLEYLLGDALAQGADTVVTSGVTQTNHGRLTAAACAKLNLRCILVRTDDDIDYYEGNRIIQQLCAAEEVFIDPIPADTPQEMEAKARLKAGDEKIARLMDELRAQGRKPYLIPRAGRSLQGTSSYAHAVLELEAQLLERGIKPDHLIVPVASGSTMTGILLGSRMCGLGAQVHGITISRSVEECKSLVEEEFNHDSAALGLPHRISRDEIIMHDDYLGGGYAQMTTDGQEAMKQLARTEGILLDPVYTGKSMAAYLDFVRTGRFGPDETVVYFHTGGSPLLFLREMSDWARDEASL